MLSSWREIRLEQLVTLQRGFDITKAEQTAGCYPVISSSGTKSYHGAFKVNGPGVVIGRKGTLGTVFFSAGDFWPHDTTLWVKEFHGNDPLFCYYFLKTMGFERYDVGASNPTLNRNHIHGLLVRVPEIGTQRRIASILSAYDDLIENNTRRIEILEEMARRLYEEWFVQFRFPGYEGVEFKESELGLIPEGWRLTTVAETFEILGGHPLKE
ncbi:restriction endonuclease subunit S [Pseudomonas sp. PIC25]|uniref:restriction endonuclease subunit S n=1 Tax=Pseudomonas sp. PIC25 TaxID=1958773 RepID=UPI00143D9AAF|nr:restriction endonuclease subunit S [Pseudomonas sp. PIC25]